MIHRRKGRKLNRTASHRNATFSNMCASLIKAKKIKTTIAKAKELRRFIEPLVTKSRKAVSRKEDNPAYDVHMRREANKFLKDRVAVKMLFDEIAPKVIDRNGGYTRVLKIGRRAGDAAELAYVEFVDYNLEKTEPKKSEPAESKKSAKTPSSRAKDTKHQQKRKKKTNTSEE